jgi:hypothetical protein
MYLTRGGSLQRPLTSWHSGCPAGQSPWPTDPTLQPLASQFHVDTLYEAVTGNLKPKLGGGRTPWPSGHHLASYRLDQVGNPSLDPYK